MQTDRPGSQEASWTVSTSDYEATNTEDKVCSRMDLRLAAPWLKWRIIF